MSGFRTDPVELFVAQARVADAASSGWTSLSRLSASVEDVLGRSWRGRAAGGVEAGFDDWVAGVRTMLAGLDELAAALGTAGAAYAVSEQDSNAGFHRIAS
jgi:uncharacterized protein YukE